MNADTAVLFYLLDDDRLYTSGMAAATRYDKKTDASGFRRMRARIVSFTTYRKMTDDPDGRIGGKSAWYGHTFKAAMGDRSYFRAEVHLQLLIALARLRAQRNGEPLPRPTAPPPAPVILPPPETSPPPALSAPVKPPRPWFRLGILIILTLMTIFSWLYVTGRLPFDYTGNYERIAMLTCYEDSVSTVLRDMVTESMAQTGRIKTLSGSALEREIGPFSLCEPPNEKILRRLFEDLQVSYLLWGKTAQRGREYFWEGTMMSHNGDHRVLRVTASGYRALAHAIVSRCLELLGSEEMAPSPVGLYSANQNASFLYSEANVHFGNGNIIAASANYQRAGTVYDPSFSMARIKWAQCLHIQGRLMEARGILEALLDADHAFSDAITLQASRSLARVYFDNHELEKLEALMASVEPLEQTAEDRLYFFQIKAQTLFLQEKQEEASLLADQARQLTHETVAPQTRIEVLLTFAWLESRGTWPKRALENLDEALSLARTYDLPSLEIAVLGERAHILLETPDLENLASFRPRLDEAEFLADRSGNVWDRLELAYWQGRVDSRLGRTEDASYHYYEAATEAEKAGILEYELKAKIALVRQKLREENISEARRLLDSVQSRIKQLPPKYQLLYFDALYSLNLQREQYLLALDAITTFQELANDLSNPNIKALALNKKGWALYRMSRLEFAEKAWLMALDLHSTYQDAVLNNLILLKEDQGLTTEAAAYRGQLKALNQSGRPTDKRSE